MTISKLADDLLPKAGSIALYVLGADTRKNRRKVYYQYERAEKAKAEAKPEEDVWPLWKDGQEIQSRKSLLDNHFQPKRKTEAAE
jgi:hypothetical protein